MYPHLTDMLLFTFRHRVALLSTHECSLCRFVLKHVLCYAPQGRFVSEGLDHFSFWFSWERLLCYILKDSVARSRNCGLQHVIFIPMARLSSTFHAPQTTVRKQLLINSRSLGRHDASETFSVSSFLVVSLGSVCMGSR